MNNGKNCVYDRKKVDFIYGAMRNAIFVVGLAVLGLLLFFWCGWAEQITTEPIPIVIDEVTVDFFVFGFIVVISIAFAGAFIYLLKWRFD